MSKSSILFKLRESKNFSQDEMARLIAVSRPSYAAIEKEEKELTVSQVQKICDCFQVSFNDFIDGRVVPLAKVELKKNNKETQQKFKHKNDKNKKSYLRISVPKEKVQLFKEVLLYILGKVGAKPNVGQTVLYKLLYFIDFDYYELFEKQLIGAKYIKNHHGPTPVAFAKIIEKMKKNKDLEEVKVKYFNHTQTKYLPIRKADLSEISAQAIEHVNNVLKKLSDKTATQLSKLSHKDVPWITAQQGEVLDYEAVFYRTRETSVRADADNNL